LSALTRESGDGRGSGQPDRVLGGRAWLGLASLALIERSTSWASSPTIALSFRLVGASLSNTMSGSLRAATSAATPWPS